MRNRNFRFENLEIWQIAIEITDELFLISDFLESQKLFRFTDQLRGAGMSISNNIAEGSGDGNIEFIRFLRYARRSAFECANILILLERNKLIKTERKTRLYNRLDELCRKITNFSKTLK